MKGSEGEIARPGQTRQERLIASARHGRRYRLTVETPEGRRSGIVKAEVTAPKFEYIPGKVLFVLEGDPLNANSLYPGPIGDIIEMEELR